MRVADDLGVGATVADFRVESLIGLGGMSTVYLARDLRLRRRVALKVLASPLADDEGFRERFLRESELAASIDHPHIVPIYQAGDADGVLYIAMRYVAGRDLKTRLRDGRMDLAEATTILAQVAQALDAAHAVGLVHRDVKPSNILLDPGTGPDGADHAYLADFGITTRLGDGRGVDDDAPLGTIDYVAPEQIAGGEIDGRVDVYSLGCVLFECLVGEPPFRRDTDVQVVFAHLDADPPSIGQRRGELPPALDAVIARALAKEPGERFSSCRELTGAALSVVVDEASRDLADLTGRATAGRHDLRQVQEALAGRVIELQTARDLSGVRTPTVIADRELCPFKGLASYQVADAENFFGRERLIAELVARLAGSTFLGIVGPSGSGKSSVLRAGLLPALAGGVLPGSENWRTVLIRPGDRPPQELQRIMATAADGPVLIVVDQLEELFTAYDSDRERTAFVDALAWGPAVVVVALRADFYSRVADHPALAERLGENHVLVGPMRESELRRAVELPAARAGLQVEPELTDRLVDDVTGEPGALPLLSTTLVELWQRRSGDTLTLVSYLESGGVRGAVARLAENTYARVPDSLRQLVRTIMLRLVGDPEVDATVRRRATLAELDVERDQAVAGVLATLVDGRLVTVSDGSVEVAHEAVLAEWPRLRGWIDEDAQGRRLRRHLTQAASEWDTSGRDPGELYRGARLSATLDWTTDHAVELNTLEREFVAGSRDASEQQAGRARRTNRRLRGLLAAVAVLLVAALVGGALAVIQRGDARNAAEAARDAETAQFAQRLGAQALVEEDRDLSLLLARQAVALDDTAQTRGYLLTALTRTPTAIGIMHGQDDARLSSVGVSPDGATLAVLDFYRRLLFFDTRTHQPVGRPLTLSIWPDSLAYSPDGTVLAYGGGNAGGGNYSVIVIDARTRQQVARTAVRSRPWQMAYTGDGTRLIVLTSEGESPPAISVLDAATLQPVAPAMELAGSLPCPEPRCLPRFVLTPDGRSVITAADSGELAWRDLPSGRITRTVPITPGQQATALSPDGGTVAVGTDGGIQVVGVNGGDVRTVGGGPAGRPNWLTFSPDGAIVVSANRDGTATVWDVASATVRDTLGSHASAVHQSVFGVDGRTLYTIGWDGIAIAWDLTGTRGIRRLFPLADPAAGIPPRLGDLVHPARISPDGRLIAVGLPDEGVALWDAHTLTPSGAPLVPPGGAVWAIAFSPDGQALAAGTGSGEVTIWDVPSRSLRAGPISVDYAEFLPGLAFTPDGSTLVTTGWSGLLLSDTETGAARESLVLGMGLGDLSLSADGTRAAFVKGNGAAVWDLATGEYVATVPGDPEADEYSVALSPDGRTLAVGGYSRFVRVWDVETQALLHEFDPGGAGHQMLEFSPDGRILAAAGTLWDMATGSRIGPVLGAGREMSLMDLSADGRQLVVTSRDGHAFVWDVDPQSWAERACIIANRILTQQEWETFLAGRPYEPACTS